MHRTAAANSRWSTKCLRRHLARRSLAVYAWGNGDNGQLGLPNNSLEEEQETFGKCAHTPRIVSRLQGKKMVSVSTSASHTAFVCNDGSLWTCGHGSDGQLGLRNYESVTEPTCVSGLPKIVNVACGNRHTVALTSDGYVIAFGNNGRGQLGIDDVGRKIHTPAPVDALARTGVRVRCISAGDDFSSVVDIHGRIYTWGEASLGRLGHGGTSTPSALRFILGEQDTEERIPRLVNGIEARIRTVYCGKHHVVALSEEGSLWTWGSGRHYLLGCKSEQNIHTPLKVSNGEKVAKIAAGGTHALILTKSGRVFSLGTNEFGCLGLGDQYVRSANEPVRVVAISQAVDVAAGWWISAAVLGPTDKIGRGRVVMWGRGYAGALGTGDPVDHWAPVDTGIVAEKVAIGASGSHVIAYDSV